MPLPVNKIVEAMNRHRLTPLQQAQQAFGKGVMLANLLSEDDKDTFIAWAQVQMLSRGMAVTISCRRPDNYSSMVPRWKIDENGKAVPG